MEKEYADLLSQYQALMDEYRLTLDENQRKCQDDVAERQVKTAFFYKQLDVIEKNLAVSEKRLQTIYAKNIVFPQYRNLVMVCSLYEYLCAGRCTELEGPDGAYNILEKEIRLDRIIVQLDEIICQLDKIKSNQYLLYSTVQEANRRLGQICGSINSMSNRLDDLYYNSIQLRDQVIESNAQSAELNASILELQKTSALTAYHAERTQKELAYMNRMDYLSGRNDDVFFNYPPV